MNRNATLNFLRGQASMLLALIKVHKAECWQRAIPGTASGQTAFNNYCQVKTTLARTRRDLKVVCEAIRFIKKNIK